MTLRLRKQHFGADGNARAGLEADERRHARAHEQELDDPGQVEGRFSPICIHREPRRKVPIPTQLRERLPKYFTEFV